jgi:DNA-binding CsgD family transcriptional regulator
MNKAEEIQQRFDAMVASLKTAIFTKDRVVYMQEVYALKIKDVTNTQKPLLKLLQNLKRYEVSDYKGFIEQQVEILQMFQQNEIHRYFSTVGRFFQALANNILGNYSEGLQLMQECHVAATEMYEARLVAEVETGLGHVFSEYGYLKIAAHYFEVSLQYSERNNIESLVMMNGFGLLKLYNDQSKPEKMRPLLAKLEPLMQKTSVPMQLSFIRWEMECLLLEKNWNVLKVKRHLFDATKGDFYNPYFFIAIQLIDAKLAVYDEKLDIGIKLFEAAIANAKQMQSKAAESIIYREFAEVLMAHHQLDIAEQYLVQSLALAKEMNSNIAYSFTYQHLHQIAIQRDNYLKALEYFKAYHNYSEKLNQEDESINAQLLQSIAMQKANTEAIAMLQSELYKKEDELQSTQYVLLQKKQLIADMDGFLGALRKENVAKNKAMLQFQKRIKESDLFETNKEQLSNVANAALTKWTEQLSKLYPQLSKLELKICYFTHKGHSNKEISSIQFTTPKSIEQAKYRIKKRLAYNDDRSLEQFLKSLNLQ